VWNCFIQGIDMRVMKFCLVAAVAAMLSAPLHAESTDDRLDRIEKLLNNQTLLDMVERLDAMQAEMQQLRGSVEEQQHTIEGLKERQRELYLDIDRRLSRFEREGGGASMPAPVVTAPAASSGGAQPLTSAAAPTAPTTPVVAAPAAAPTNDANQMQQEREAYQKAFDTLRELRYAQATQEFRAFLKQYPNGRYGHIAQYWLGEASYAQRNFKQAIIDYQGLLKGYPSSPKRAEAMLKIGYSQHELKQDKEAKQTLDQLIKLYPDSTEAGQARNLLKQIRKQAG
jgi:tol-pal system protein YbgF